MVPHIEAVCHESEQRAHAPGAGIARVAPAAAHGKRVCTAQAGPHRCRNRRYERARLLQSRLGQAEHFVSGTRHAAEANPKTIPEVDHADREG